MPRPGEITKSQTSVPQPNDPVICTAMQTTSNPAAAHADVQGLPPAYSATATCTPMTHAEMSAINADTTEVAVSTDAYITCPTSDHASNEAVASRAPLSTKTAASRLRRKELVDAKQELLRLHEEMAEARATLEEDSDSDDATDQGDQTMKLLEDSIDASQVQLCSDAPRRSLSPPNLLRAKQPSTDHSSGLFVNQQRPFKITALDYFGPMIVKVDQSCPVRYGALFMCLKTRAAHIELVGGMTTDSAVMALRRFMARRGCPTEIWSYHATKLRGYDAEFEVMQEEAGTRGVTWCYFPPDASSSGWSPDASSSGWWERRVRNIKNSLAKVLYRFAMTEQLLATLLVGAECTANSGPTCVSASEDDCYPLTPNDFLLGGPSIVPLPVGRFVANELQFSGTNH